MGQARDRGKSPVGYIAVPACYTAGYVRAT